MMKIRPLERPLLCPFYRIRKNSVTKVILTNSNDLVPSKLFY